MHTHDVTHTTNRQLNSATVANCSELPAAASLSSVGAHMDCASLNSFLPDKGVFPLTIIASAYTVWPSFCPISGTFTGLRYLQKNSVCTFCNFHERWIFAIPAECTLFPPPTAETNIFRSTARKREGRRLLAAAGERRRRIFHFLLRSRYSGGRGKQLRAAQQAHATHTCETMCTVQF